MKLKSESMMDLEDQVREAIWHHGWSRDGPIRLEIIEDDEFSEDNERWTPPTEWHVQWMFKR